MKEREKSLRELRGCDGRVPGLRRGLEVLEYLQGHPKGAIIAVVAEALKVPDNSMIRVLNTLSDFGYVARNPQTMEYRLTRKMMQLALDGSMERTLTECAVGVMRELRDAIDETIILSVMGQGTSIVLEQVPSTNPFRFVCDAGFSQPLHVSASPKAMLAFLDEHERDAILRHYEFKPFTKSSITTRDGFEREMKEIRSAGYALDRDEHIEGIHCAAAPILDSKRRPVAAITVIGPSFRVSLADLPRIGELVREHALRIEARYCGFA